MPTTDLSASQIRQQFIDFFREKHAHTFAPSSPVVPHNDPTLLFTNAGMNQFKPVFLGTVDPASDMAKMKRAVNSQKCIRAGGKHNDLGDVGKDLYHHTFFEMLGNWSFGDFFKEEAIDWAWELFTKVWGMDESRLYATYFEGDESEGLAPDLEARDLWLQHLPADRVLPGDMKDNFWEMGDTGPCGPCSEIHYDGRTDAERAQTPGAQLVNADHEQVIELWNLVFIQFDRFAPGGSGLKNLPAKHVDTGMGLERIVRTLQGKQSNYATDLFTPLFVKIQQVTGAKQPYGDRLDSPEDTAYRVIADHIRTLTFAITDGADPSNEGRGYVLRRILRRAVRYGRQTLGAKGVFLADLVPTVVEEMGGFFPELTKNPQRVIDVIRDEEESFGRTLQQGASHFDHAIAIEFAGLPLKQEHKDIGAIAVVDQIDGAWIVQIRRDSDSGTYMHTLTQDDLATQQAWDWFEQKPVVVPAEDAFKLHDTYGFPIDLTQIMAEERGLTVDVAGFERLMEEARERSRAGGGGASCETKALKMDAEAVAQLQHQNIAPTDDSAKFGTPIIPATLRAIWTGDSFTNSIEALKPDERVALICDKTCFYAEMGGQVGDHGEIHSAVGGAQFNVENTVAVGGYALHVGTLAAGAFSVGDDLELRLDTARRETIAANHTATHLLNWALRSELGAGVDQKGSLVAPDKLRFDFSHNSSVTPEELKQIEIRVRAQIKEDLPVHAQPAPLESAQKINNLRAVFGETYPDPVRVVSIGPPVDILLNDPDAERWSKYSIEFCGGTHLATTREAQHFAIIEETAVAKGVRRMSALTRDAAKRAIDAGGAILDELATIKKLPDDQLEAPLAALAERIEAETIPLALKVKARTGVAEQSERVKAARKASAAGARDEAVAAARAVAESETGAAIVATVPAGSDRGALLGAMDAVRAKRADAAIMLLSADGAESKVSIVASVPEAHIASGLKAGDWVREAAQACGGKGGGKPDKAQGGGTEPDKVNEAVEAARAFASERLGSSAGIEP